MHPDLYVQGSDSEKRISMQMATLANVAYRTLINPIQRGLYLCIKNGVDPQLETNTSMPAQFLMQQMDWRELLDESRNDSEKLDHLYQQVETVRQGLLLEVEMAIDQAHNFQLAAEKLRALLFIEKFCVELEDAMSA